jgi:GH25 family lysozyme M1 (1,4-beta-N-acetylmuramidase)
MRRTLLLSSLASVALLASCAVETTADEDVAGQEDYLVVCGDGPTVEGIDVSSWQGAIDWSAVAGAGIKFAIVRIGDGSYHDRYFAANWAGARSAGLIRGAYQFFEPGQDALMQADLVVAAVGRLGPGDLPVTIDVEAPSPGVSSAAYARSIHQWVDRVTAGTGRAPMIYTGRYYWDPYVASSDFTSLPLWHAQYTTAACPNLNDRWSDWAFWQYTSSGRVAGIAGNVDRNRWNGTYEALQALAMSNQAPTGWLDAAACDGIRGWAQDPDSPAAPIDVHVYIGGPAGDPAAVGFPLHASVSRDDLCTPLGSCEHGFSMPVPLSFFDGADHLVYAYGIDSSGGPNTLLRGAPQTLHCDTPPFPNLANGVVRRHVPSPEVLAAWGLGFLDVAPVSDALLGAIPDGPALEAAPELVQAEGDPAVYLREDGALRHVPSPAVLDAWHFARSAIRSVAPTELANDLRGADVLGTPFLARGSGPAVYLIDAPPPLWAELVSGALPAVLETGRATQVTLRFRNRGSLAWAQGEVALAPTPRDVASEVCDPSWPSCERAATAPTSVAPGEEGDFVVRLEGPMDTGPVTVCFGLVVGTHWFSDPGQLGPADDSLCRTIDVVGPARLPDGGDTAVTSADGVITGGCSVGAARGASHTGHSRPASIALAGLACALVLRRARRRAR